MLHMAKKIGACQCTFGGLRQDFVTGEMEMVLKIPADFKYAAKQIADDAQGKKLSLSLSQYSQKRSLDANAYCWTLIGKLAIALRISPEEVYRDTIREIGDNFEIFPIKNEAVDHWREIWQSKGMGWMCESMGESKLPGYTNMINFYGSSTYDTRQMSALIDCIIHECKEQGIETDTPEQIARLKREWKA